MLTVVVADGVSLGSSASWYVRRPIVLVVTTDDVGRGPTVVGGLVSRLAGRSLRASPKRLRMSDNGRSEEDQPPPAPGVREKARGALAPGAHRGSRAFPRVGIFQPVLLTSDSSLHLPCVRRLLFSPSAELREAVP